MSVQPVQQKIKFPLLGGILKINQLNISSAPQILNKQVGEKMLKSTGTLNLSMFRENWDVVVTNEFNRV